MATERSLRARRPTDGGERFVAATSPYRRELLVHCYRMLGSADDADDLVQETMTRAWRAFDRYDPAKASLRTWLYRIATNACLNALRERARRPLPSGVGARFDDPDAPLVPGIEVPWLQPLADAALVATGGDPELSALERADLRLALVASLQMLSPLQRAVLLLRETLQLPAAEVAATLSTTTAAVNSALQRARAGLALGRPAIVPVPTAEQRAVVERYLDAFLRADVAGLVQLCVDDVVLEMPPMRNWYLGREHYARFMARVFRTRGTAWRFMPVGANGQPAAAAYLRGDDGRYALHTLQIFTVGAGGIERTTVFQTAAVFAAFGLAPTLTR